MNGYDLGFFVFFVPLWFNSSFQSHQPFLQSGLPFTKSRQHIILVHHRKQHHLSRPQLAEQVEVGRDDVRDLWIAADRLAVDAEHDALPVVDHLHRTWTDWLGY